MATHGQLSALVTLIADATKVVESHYQKFPEKPYVPSLDDVEPHPLDDAISDKELRNAIQTIEGACAQLTATVARPSHTLVNRFMTVFETNALDVAVRFKVADILQEKPEGMHISEIGKKSGAEERKIGRILRCLASKHCFREVTKDVFANNRLSMLLLSTNPVSSIGLHFTDECQKSAVLLSETLADPEWGHSYSPYQCAFNKYSGYPKGMFDHFEGVESEEGAKRGARFGVGAIGWGTATEAGALIHHFPWNDLPKGTSVCDIGGGVGNVTMQLAHAYPSLKLVLQDLPERIQQAKNEVWPKECPLAIQEDRILFEPINFLTESPVKACDIYYLKHIIHDWPDADCIKILSGVKKAMAPHSRVMIHEYILQYANRVPADKSDFQQAPEPLLPNYGAGRIRQYNLDIDMMAVLNSEERTVEHFKRLGEAAGLKFTRVWDLGESGLVEFGLP
ncbi:S-adenosyl-L-methionine-dependent methyltransferase [Crucibulum laeve]|uniref:S-adenosyl-L-methionine-dependent methyltransferase n=1 Tax=Crucibulum laeve TaxID=68775 RepID=A0A5C3LSP7_9AGAR|nr:S-adenosyl-L-methionine-dependent methyltransferase [Crucibulum laeve]